MFDQILEMVKEHLGNNPDVPAAQQDALHHEVATQITTGLANQVPQQGGIGGLLSKLQDGLTSGSPIAAAIEGGLVNSLASKFGLPPAISGAISGVLPGLLQKFAHKANDPNDTSITPDSISNSLSNLSGAVPNVSNVLPGGLADAAGLLNKN